MKSFTVDEKNFYIDGKPTYFNCGEFHYYRVPKADWEKRMILLKEAGGNAVATYIPWLIHEPEEGKFVFNAGDGFTDFEDFLKCAQKVGLYVVARPGPYAYSELENSGLPDWLITKYPQILAVRRNGQNHGRSNISYLHPVFLEKAKNYYRAVCPIIARYTLKNGGPIAAVQLDNELTGIHVWFGDRDFNAETMGFGTEDGLYPSYLKRKYGTVEAVNKAYGTTKASFSGFEAKDEPAEGVAKVRWNEDYIEFYNQTVSLYLETLMNYAEEFGVECQFCHNAANPWMDVVFRDAKKRFGNKLFIGSDHYFTLCQTWEQNNPTPQFMTYCFMSGEMLRLLKNPPCILETQYGSISEWPPTSAEDVEALLMCQFAGGVRGHNGYVFTGGPNPPNAGTTCNVYDYGAPVSATGECRKTYYAIKNFGKFVAEHPEFATDKPDTDVRMAMPWRGYTGTHGTIEEGKTPELGTLVNAFQKGVLSGFFAAALQTEFIDDTENGWTEDKSTPVFVPCDGMMSEIVQQRYLDFIQSGGNVVFFPVLPLVNEKYEPCTLLRDALNIPEIVAEKHGLGAYKFQFVGDDEFFDVGEGGAYFSELPAGAEQLGTELKTGKCVSWRLPAGKGSVSWFGATNVLVRLAYVRALKTIFQHAGGQELFQTDNTWIMKYRRRTSKGVGIFLANLGTTTQDIRCKYRKTPQSPWEDLEPMSLKAMEVKFVYL